jgi:hypothetical protein
MYFANNYWVAAVSLGCKARKRVRRKVTGRTKTEVKAKLRDLHSDLDSGGEFSDLDLRRGVSM